MTDDTTPSTATQWESQTIGKLAEAVAKMQSQISGVLKQSDNPFFKSKYADLAACWRACHEAASENGIAIIQTTRVIDGKLSLVTTLAHSSGEWMSGFLPLIYKDGPTKVDKYGKTVANNPMQALGSAITYARRYGLCAAVGLAQEDDDGNSAAPPQGQQRTPAPQPEPKKYNDARDDLAQAIRDSPVDANSRSAVDAAFHHITGDVTCTVDSVFGADDASQALDLLGRIQQARNDGHSEEQIWKP